MCDKKLTSEDLKTYMDKVKKIYDNPSNMRKIIVHQQNDLSINLDISTNVWTMCTHDMLMIDFDFKSGLNEDKL